MRIFLSVKEFPLFLLNATKNSIIISPVIIFLLYLTPINILFFPIIQILSYAMIYCYTQYRYSKKIKKQSYSGYYTIRYLIQLIGYDYLLKMFLAPMGVFILIKIMMQFDDSIQTLFTTNDFLFSAYFLGFWLFSGSSGIYALTLKGENFKYFTALGIRGQVLKKRLIIFISSIQFLWIYLVLMLFCRYSSIYIGDILSFSASFISCFIMVNTFQWQQAQMELKDKKFDGSIPLTQHKVTWQIILQSFLVKLPIVAVLLIQKTFNWTTKQPLLSLSACLLVYVISIVIFKKIERDKTNEFITVKKHF